MNNFSGVKPYVFQDYKFEKNHTGSLQDKQIKLEQLVEKISFFDGMVISFHHHLRNGDYVANMLFEIIKKTKIKDVIIVASSIFPIHEPMVELIKSGQITKIYTAYVSGPVAKCVSQGYLRDGIHMHSHGARARLLLNKEVNIDLAFIASPAVDKNANITGSLGPSSCGVLGYAYADALVAKHVVAVTDYITDEIIDFEISGQNVDFVIGVDEIGDSKGIVSGTTQVTKDPIGLMIANNTVQVIKHSGLFKNGMSFQTGAGGISLAVAQELKEMMINNNIKGSFASGGITAYLVDMLEKGLFEELYDVQCFDLCAVKSISKNPNHNKMSASRYANPYDKNNIVKDLDVVILGATEIDLDFNVNVTTTSYGEIMGGAGGHSDTAAGAKLAIIVSKLVSSRISVVRKRVTTITTPGETIDVLVTDHGIAINPKHQDLIANLKAQTNLKIYTMQELHDLALSLTGTPKEIEKNEEVVGIVEYRDGTLLDKIYKISE